MLLLLFCQSSTEGLNRFQSEFGDTLGLRRVAHPKAERLYCLTCSAAFEDIFKARGAAKVSYDVFGDSETCAVPKLVLLS